MTDRSRCGSAAKRISALNDAEQHDDNRDNQEDVNEASGGVRRRDPEEPQNEEDDDYCCQHGDFLSIEG